MKYGLTISVLILVSGLSSVAFAGRASLTIAQCKKAPTIDGKIDTVEWADAAAM